MERIKKINISRVLLLLALSILILGSILRFNGRIISSYLISTIGYTLGLISTVIDIKLKGKDANSCLFEIISYSICAGAMLGMFIYEITMY